MDWLLSVTTLLVNSSLGWFKGRWWVWVLHATNAAAWIIYALIIEQYGLILLSASTIVVDAVSGYKAFHNRSKTVCSNSSR